MRSLAWFATSQPRWLRHWCLAPLASRRRGFSHRASSIGPIRRARSRTAICPAGPANNQHRITNRFHSIVAVYLVRGFLAEGLWPAETSPARFRSPAEPTRPRSKTTHGRFQGQGRRALSRALDSGVVGLGCRPQSCGAERHASSPVVIPKLGAIRLRHNSAAADTVSLLPV